MTQQGDSRAVFVFSLGCVFGLMGEFLIAPRRFALGVVDLEPGEGFVYGERPTVEQQASHLECLFMAVGVSDRGRSGVEVGLDALLEGWF